MSKIQKTTQLKNKPKVSTIGLSGVSSQIKSSTSTSKAADEKDKIKSQGTTEAAKTGISKTQTSLVRKVEGGSTNKASTGSTVRANARAAGKANTGTTVTGKANAGTAVKAKVVSAIHKANSGTTATKNTVPIKKRLPPARSATTTTTEKPTDKTQPVRAKYSVAIVEAVKKNASGVRSSSSKKDIQIKPNAVLDTFHNVTVVSPPPVRKKETKRVEKKESAHQQDALERPVRTGTGTLEPEEIIVLRSESAKKRSERQILDDEAELQQMSVTLKEPVAFEVNFKQPATLSASKNRDRSKSRSRNDGKGAATAAEDEQSNYSDDFESYESDFETGSGTSQNESTTETESNDSDDGSKSVNGNDSSSSSDAESAAAAAADNVDDIKDVDESEEESELTQYPVTVIQREKERERKLDSGHYEMNSRTPAKLSELSVLSSQPQQQQQFDSLDTFSATTSDQLDSGISSYGNASDLVKVKGEVFYGGYAHFNTRPILSKRGKDLMSKIQFDTLTFSLFEMKPISYEIYMQTYGKLNTTQSSTQTHENNMAADCQTDDCDVRSMWTQHPPQYDLQTVQKLENGLIGGSTAQNCCGELSHTDMYASDTKPADEYETSLLALNAFRQNYSSRTLNQHFQKRSHKPIDFERLNAFLLTSSMLMANVLNSAAKSSNNTQKHDNLESAELAAISGGYFNLGTRFLNALRVVRIFANSKHNLVVTVHESLPDADVYRSDFSNLLMVWSTSESSKPIRLLSTWSEVCRAEICNDFSDIIVCGLRDGSIAMWDLRETYSFCSKLDGYLTHFAATQSIVPTWGQHGGDKTNKILTDMGAVVDVKSFRTPPRTLGLSNAITGYKSIQFTSLNDSGILTVWTLVETAARQYDISTDQNTSQKSRNSPRNHNSKFEYSSPWARVKLIQSAICDLRDYLNRGALKAQSQFDKTKSHFQKNIYSDEVLRELNDTHSGMRRGQGQGIQGLRFTSIDTGCERIYVCTNRNFILACSKMLKMERFRKITINESRFLFPTALRVLTNEDFLAVGLSNGSVMIVNCNQYKAQRHSKDKQSNSLTNRITHDAIKLPGTPDIVLETGKSCAIQNIILNERRSFDSDANYMQNYPAADDSRPTTAAFIEMITNQKRPFELRVYDQQLLLSGSVLRKHLVQSLELSSDGWHLFALSNGEVRTYDFYLDREVECHVRESDKTKIVDIAVARTAHIEQHLLILNTDDDVQVHLIKQ